ALAGVVGAAICGAALAAAWSGNKHASKESADEAWQFRLQKGRTFAREQVVGSLLRGEITVPEAVGRFRELGDGDTNLLRPLRLTYPGLTDEALFFRQLVSYVQAELGE